METNASRPVDRYFEKYGESHRNHTNKLVHWICVPLIVFSIFGLVWAIPFPHFAIFGKDNVLNWASFLLAFSIYFYYRLSPVLSYIMLIVSFAFCGLVVYLERMHVANGWPAMWQICLAVFVASWIGQFIGHKIEGKKPSFIDDIRFLLIGPIWLIASVLRKYRIKY